MAKVQVYAGIVLIASITNGEVHDLVSVDSSGNFQIPNLRLYAGENISIIAQDTSGNEARYETAFH